MRTYRSSMPESKLSPMNQPPLMGPGWPRVVGTPLSSLGPEQSGIAGTRMGAVTGLSALDEFPIYFGAAGLCFLLGKQYRIFTLGAAVFAGLAVYKAWRVWRNQ